MRASRIKLGHCLLALCLAACAAQDDTTDTQSEPADVASEQATTPSAGDVSASNAAEAAAEPEASAESAEPPAPADGVPAFEPESDAPAETAASIFSPSCPSNPCRNGGTCRETLFSYACTCPAGFTGAQCQTATTGGGTGGR